MNNKKLFFLTLLIISLLLTGCGSKDSKKKSSVIENNEGIKYYNIKDYNMINETTNNLVDYIKSYGNGGINIAIKEAKIEKYSDGEYKTVILISEEDVDVTLKFDSQESLIGITVKSPYGHNIPSDYYNVKLSLANYDYLGLSGSDEYMKVLSGLVEGPVIVNGWSISGTLDTSDLHVFSIQKEK